MHDERERVTQLLDDVAAGRDPRDHVTTLPAKTGSFCAGRNAPCSSRSFSGYARPSGPRWCLRARSKPTLLWKHLKAQRP